MGTCGAMHAWVARQTDTKCVFFLCDFFVCVCVCVCVCIFLVVYKVVKKRGGSVGGSVGGCMEWVVGGFRWWF